MKLIFVYNADSGHLNAAMHSLHKLVSPKTYSCSLCAVTYHPLGMKKQWARFIETIGCTTEFLHRDEAQARFNLKDIAWPAILREDEQGVSVWMNAEDLGKAQTLDDLERVIRERLDHEEN